MDRAGPGREPVVLRYPMDGRLRAVNSPASKVPSHGSDLFGTTYAIDLVPVDDRGRSKPVTWRTLVATEPPDAFVGFGSPVRAPIDGTVVVVYDGAPDHVARRSIVTAVPYMVGQARRLRTGLDAIVGNHVVVAVGAAGPFVLLAHLRRGSAAVRPGDRVRAGDRVGACGNSGNSTQPHLHLQVTDTVDWPNARGLPIVFATDDGLGLPVSGQVVVVPRRHSGDGPDTVGHH